MARFPGVDYLLIDSLFSEQELLIRQTARQFVEDRVIPIIRDCLSRRALSQRADPGNRRAWIPGRESGRLRLRGSEQRRIRADHAGNRARRFGTAQLRFGARRAGDVSDLHLWVSRTEGALAAENAVGRSHRMLWTDRAGLRIESRGHADAREAGRRSLDFERREDLDHKRLHGRRRHRLGARGGRHSRIPGGEGHARVHHVRYSRQAFDARIGDVQPGAVGLPGARVRDAARRAGAESVR